MTFKDRSPLEILGLTNFGNQYGDLISVQAEYYDPDKIIIEKFNDFYWTDNFTTDEYERVNRTTRACYNFLMQGTEISYEKVAKEYLKSFTHISILLNTSLNAYINYKDSDFTNYDLLIKNILELYKELYEGLMPYIIAPIVFALKLKYNINEPLAKIVFRLRM